MSYCRWSCLNGYSDVYVYEDSGGWTTHVAKRKQPPGAPEHLDFRLDEWREANPLQDIDHPEAGASFNHSTPGECADNLERLRAEGLTVPDWAIDELRAEMAQQTE